MRLPPVLCLTAVPREFVFPAPTAAAPGVLAPCRIVAPGVSTPPPCFAAPRPAAHVGRGPPRPGRPRRRRLPPPPHAAQLPRPAPAPGPRPAPWWATSAAVCLSGRAGLCWSLLCSCAAAGWPGLAALGWLLLIPFAAVFADRFGGYWPGSPPAFPGACGAWLSFWLACRAPAWLANARRAGRILADRPGLGRILLSLDVVLPGAAGRGVSFRWIGAACPVQRVKAF